MVTQKIMVAKPKHQRQKMEGYGAEEEFQRIWRGEMGHGWCRRVGGDRGQRRNNTTGEGKEERNLFGPKSQPLQKRLQKSAVQASVPGREREKRVTRNEW